MQAAVVPWNVVRRVLRGSEFWGWIVLRWGMRQNGREPCFVEARPDGEIGRHSGLKIRRP